MSQFKRKREEGSPEPAAAAAKEVPSASAVPTAVAPNTIGAKVFHCDYCHRDITNQVRIRCAECQEFDLCLDCFSVGAEISSHKRTHSYRVMEKLDFSVLSSDWTAHEELMLLQALDLYGLGNWVEVAMHVGSQSKSKCEEHYYQYYIDFPGTGPYPDVSRCTERNTLIPLSASTVADMQKTAEARHMTPQHQPTKKRDYYADCPPGSEIVGYMPRRGDFDVEYDNDAEAVLADLTIDSKDSEWETKLKTTLLEAYNWRLEERRKRKEFVLKRDLLDLKKQQLSDRRRTPEDKDLHQQLRVFSRVMVPDKYDELLMGLVQEQRIRKRIRELQDFRATGCLTFDDIERKKAEMPDLSGSSSSGGHHVHKHKHWKSEAAEKKKMLAEQAAKLARQPGGEFLSDQETSLCESLSISPMQYLQCKELILRESIRLGGLSREAVLRMVKIELHQNYGGVYDFAVSCGWVKRTIDPVLPPPAPPSDPTAAANASDTVTAGSSLVVDIPVTSVPDGASAATASESGM